MNINQIKSIRDSKLPCNEKTVLQVLNTYADENGECWPSVRLIAEGSSLNKRSIFRSLAALKAMGILSVFESQKGKISAYKIHYERVGSAYLSPVTHSHPCQPVTTPMTHSHPTHDTQSFAYIEEDTNEDTNEDTPIIPKEEKPDFGMKTVFEESGKAKTHLPALVNHQPPVPILNRSNAVKSAPKEPRYRDDQEFMQFWEQYPRKRRGDPHAAYKTWQELIIAREAHPEDILRGCVIYAHSREGSGDYAQGCQRWLNDYGWMKNYTTQGDPYAKFNPVRAMLNLQDTGGELKEGVDYIVICGERVLI